MAALGRWGILERLEATGCPPVTTYEFDLGPVSIAGSPRPVDGEARAFAPRRTVLDALLVDAAVAAGAELREAFTVDEVLFDDGRVSGIGGHAKGGAHVTERARVVIGADGMHSLVAKAVRPRRYHEVPRLTPLYYAYWSGLPVDEFKTYERAEHGRGWAVSPTHDGLTCVVQGWPQEEFEANRKDVEGAFMRSFDLVPEFAERIHAATRETRFVGSGNLPGFFRQPYGPGWALVGDAGHHKHPITGFGMSDAFRDAELLASALDDCFAGRRPYEDALARLPAGARRAGAAALRAHLRLREARAASARPAGADRRDAGQPGRDGRLRERHGGHAPGARVLRAREHGADHGARGGLGGG